MKTAIPHRPGDWLEYRDGKQVLRWHGVEYLMTESEVNQVWKAKERGEGEAVLRMIVNSKRPI
jgi:hypothetical protein